ncbi:hypothetical protein FQN52_005223 [Onygenales sp. PD_12]|nr:hypothetical protein FQN52_005223 [Onygenales sp. PD_12]
MPISHIGLSVPLSRFNETVTFYKSALAPLGYKEHLRPVENVVGLGAMYPDFWITGVKDDDDDDEPAQQQPSVHVAFSIKHRALAHAFHAAALAAGGECNGGPGPRPQYHRFYYAAFVRDPVGNNIEAVCMWPAWTHWEYWVGWGVFGKGEGEGKKGV